jgi:heptosyltransferase-2
MIQLIKFLDRVFGPIIIILLWILRPIKKLFATKGNALVLKLWALGDSVLSLVLIEKLSAKFGKVDVLARRRNLIIYNHNKIRKVYRIKSLPRLIMRYEYVFDCEPYLNISAIMAYFVGKKVVGFDHGVRSILYDVKIKFRTDQHMVQNYLDMARAIGIKCDSDRLEEIDVSKKAKEKVEKFLVEMKLQKSKLAGLTIGAAETATAMRMWPLDRFAKTAEHLGKKGFIVFFIGSPSEKDLIENCRSMIKGQQVKTFISSQYFNLEETIYLISKLGIFVSNDTGPMHIAAAQGVKTIGLFGPNTPVLWGPFGKGNISIYKNHPKSPCIDNKKGTIGHGCKNIEFMKDISVEDVLSAIDRIVSDN